jgi:LysM repeat protein
VIDHEQRDHQPGDHITAPSTSAAGARSGGSALASGGEALSEFVSSLAGRESAVASSQNSRATFASRGGEFDFSYTVRPGDTLSSIATGHGTTATAVAVDNGLSGPDHITPGEHLSLR